MGSIRITMSGCTQTGKPRIAILMAVYEPRMGWLREQLESLEAQTYPNLKLYIRDDCSPTVSLEEIQKCAAECIRSFPYEIKRNEKNLGSNGAFELLTQEAEGKYFAYCDQDDIWLPEKLEVLQRELEGSGARLVCSDMYIIDGEGRQTADSITKVRRRHRFRSGDGLAEGLLISNFVTGCTMLIQAETAKTAVPFCPHMVHDHYLALYGAEKGKIVSVPRRLISYRVHGSNQTDLLAGVTDKRSYGRIRIDSMLDRLLWLRENFPCGGETAAAIEARVVWARARQRNWTGRGGKKTIWKYRAFSLIPSLFEIAGNWLPESAFQILLAMGKRNII